MMIVRYLMNGAFRATRHAEGCGVLRRALREQERSQGRHWHGGGYEALLVMTESEYAGTGAREPKDCRCVEKALAEVRS
jgi:hypothetical protein